MKKRDIIIVTICIATALICIVLTFWGNYKNDGVLSPEAFYGVLATFIGICATIIVGFQIANFVKIHETERQMKKVQEERNKMEEDREELYRNIKSIRTLLSNALVGIARNTDNNFDKVLTLIMSIYCEHGKKESGVLLSRYNTLITVIKKCSSKELYKVYDHIQNLKDIDIPKDTEHYIEIMKLHLETIQLVEEAAKKEKEKETKQTK